MQTYLSVIFYLVFLSNFTVSGFAGETDQYLAGDATIEDSHRIINSYYNEQINSVLSKNSGQSCEQLTNKILGQIIKELNTIISKSFDVDRFPNNSIKNSEYIQMSIYDNAGFPLNVAKLKRTINIGGVYIGTDKFGHFGLIGRNYYHHYLRYLQSGLNREEAEKATVIHGIKQELGILGYYYNGVLSFADLEANYQGLLFALDLCHNGNAYLIKKNGYWIRNNNRIFDIRNYINPKMDESFNTSFRSPKLWRKIQYSLKNIYCPLLSNPLFLERMAQYKTRVQTNKNDHYIKEYFRSKPKYDKSVQSVDELCL